MPSFASRPAARNDATGRSAWRRPAITWPRHLRLRLERDDAPALAAAEKAIVEAPVKVRRTTRGKTYVVWRARFADPRTGVHKTRYFRSRREAQAAIDDEALGRAAVGEVLQHPIHLQLFLYTVTGTLGGEPRSIGVVCCHAEDARAMVARRVPDIGDLEVVRGPQVHYIVVGSTQFLT